MLKFRTNPRKQMAKYHQEWSATNEGKIHPFGKIAVTLEPVMQF